MSVFAEAYKDFHLKESTPTSGGLRKNQVGAIGSVIAHFSVRDEAALVSMPTGTGKTAVMLGLCFALRANKVLVVTPSQLVRKQIARQFSELRDLINNEVLPRDVQRPRVYTLAGVVNSREEWDGILAGHDVVVGIPGTLNKIEDLSSTLPAESFDLILVDEAHHSRAKSWANLLRHFSGVKQVLLTATAFRNDGKDIKARLVYNFPLRLAYERGLFSKIEYIPVATEGIPEQEARDMEIARKTEDVYESHKVFGHKIIIRTDSKARATQLKRLYDSHTALKLQLISSDLQASTVDKRIGLLEAGEADGVICVDMMGEGYDFPSLKIAAIHAPHKSLAITLQFVGRIARTNVAQAKVAKVIAGTHDFEIESVQLFKDTRDWATILPNLHEAKTDQTEAEQEFYDTLTQATEPTPSYVVETEEAMVLADTDLRPFFHTKVFRVNAYPLEPDEDGVLPEIVDINAVPDFSNVPGMQRVALRHHHVSVDFHVAVFVLSELIVPAWYTVDDSLKDVKNTLLLVYYDNRSSLLFICSSLKDNELYKAVADSYVIPGLAYYETLSLPLLKRILAGWKEAKFYNLGMRSRKTRGSNESYQQRMGSTAQKTLNRTDALNYTQGHSFGKGFDEVLQKEMLLGISTGSKVWSIVDGKISALIDWLTLLGTKIAEPENDNRRSPLDKLDCGRDIEKFPISDGNVLLLADWDGLLYSRETKVAFLDADGHPGPAELLISCEIHVRQEECTETQLVFEVKKAASVVKVNYSIVPNIRYEYAGDTPYTLGILQGSAISRKRSFLHLLEEAHVNFLFEDMSKLVGRTILKFDFDGFKTLPPSAITPVDWSSEQVNIQREFYSASDVSDNAANGETRPSIHDYIIQIASQEFEAVYYDHASLEVADVLAFNPDRIRFYHCKKQKGDTPRCSVDDIYEVCGQAVKSAVWTNRKLLQRQLLQRNNNGDTGGRVKKGSLSKIKVLLDGFESSNLPVEIVIVHPGLKTTGFVSNQADSFERVRMLLSGAYTYLESIGTSTLSVMSS
jgi:superfamily II DNA or RNA helicase